MQVERTFPSRVEIPRIEKLLEASVGISTKVAWAVANEVQALSKTYDGLLHPRLDTVLIGSINHHGMTVVPAADGSIELVLTS